MLNCDRLEKQIQNKQDYLEVAKEKKDIAKRNKLTDQKVYVDNCIDSKNKQEKV